VVVQLNSPGLSFTVLQLQHGQLKFVSNLFMYREHICVWFEFAVVRHHTVIFHSNFNKYTTISNFTFA